MQHSTTDTIAALATGAHPQAIGMARLSGPRAWEIVLAMLPDEQRERGLKPQRARVVTLADDHGGLLDQAVLLPWKAPHSYTGEDMAEVMCHGAPAVLHLVLQRLVELGARQAEPGEFTLRAFLNEKLSLDEAEAVERLIGAQTATAVRSAARQLDSGLRRQVEALLAEVVDLRSQTETALDFVEEEIALLDPDEAVARLEQTLSAIQRLRSQYQAGKILNRGATVALAGPPNSGKSTLLNCFAGQDRAIVSDTPGTTRDFVDVLLDWEGAPVRVIDTAGLHTGSSSVEQAGIERARRIVRDADVVIWLCAPPEDLPPPDELEVHGFLRPVYAMADRERAFPRPWPRVSGTTGQGLEELKTEIVDHLLAGHDPGAVVVAEQRHFDLLGDAEAALQRAVALLLNSGVQNLELLAVELGLTHEALGTITGINHTEELLTTIFSRFCIGK